MRDAELIYRSAAMSAYFRRGRSPWTLVAFGDAWLVGEHNEAPRRGFVERADLSAVLVVPHRRDWYPREQAEPCVAAIRAVLGDATVVTYGASMGAYAAIKYASRLGASRTIAVAPQYSLDPTIIQLRNDAFVKHFQPEIHSSMEISAGDVAGPVEILLDPTDANDREHADFIRRRIPCRLTHVRHAGHTLEMMFGGGTDIYDLISGFLAGDRASIAAQIRAAKRRSAYFHMTLHRALTDFKPRLAHWALATVLKLPAFGTDDRVNRASALSKLGRADVAARELREAYDRATRRASQRAFAIALSSTMWALEQPEEATRWMRIAASHAPDDENATVGLASMLARARLPREAEALLDDLLRRFDHARGHHVLSLAQAAQGHDDAAIVSGLRALSIDPRNPEGRLHLATLLRRAGREGEAEALLIGATRAIGDAGSWFEWSRFLHAAGRLPEALRAARRAVLLTPSAMSMRGHLASLLIESGFADEALSLCRQSTLQWPAGGIAWMQLCQTQRSLLLLPEAIVSARRAIAEEPCKPGYRAVLVTLLWRIDDLDAAKVASDAAEADGVVPSVALLAARGRVLARLGDLAGAIEATRRAVEMAPDNASLLEGLAHYLMRANRLDEAEAAARVGLALPSPDPGLHRVLIAILTRRGQHQEAAEVARQAAASHPDAADFRAKLAEALLSAGQSAEALEVVAEARARGFESAELSSALAKGLHRSGDLASAIEAARHAVELAPGNSGYFNALAYFLLQAKRPAEAEIAARSGLALRPDASGLRDALQIALKRQGKRE